MQALIQETDTQPAQRNYSAVTENKMNTDSIKSYCWYCSHPVYNRRTFCSTKCREALYEDNEYARGRRRILGCHC